MTNREIKFRAWAFEDDVTQFMYYQEYLGGEWKTKGDSVLDIHPDGFRNKDFPLMQYTGLKDKFGKEIYEGDIVKLDEGEGIQLGDIQIVGGFGRHAYQVVWHELGWRLYDNDKWHLNLSPYAMKEYTARAQDGDTSDRIEVIGNIYENPELLDK